MEEVYRIYIYLTHICVIRGLENKGYHGNCYVTMVIGRVRFRGGDNKGEG